VRRTLLARAISVLTSFALVLGVMVATALAPDPVSAAQSAECPAPGDEPGISTLPSPIYTDTNVSVFAGGNFLATGGAAESEGLNVFLGDATIAKPSGVFNVGTAGVGSGISPPPGGDMLIVGGDLTVNANNTLTVGANAFDDQGVLQGGRLHVGGTITNDGTIEPKDARATINPSTAAEAYASFPAAIADLSSDLADEPGTAANVAGSQVILTGDGTTALQVFTISASALVGKTEFFFSNINQQQPSGAFAPIVINVEGGPATSLSPTLISMNGARVDVFGNPDFGPAASAILWNFPDATDVTIGGSSQLMGSILVPSTSGNVAITASTNGRVYVGNNLTVSGTGQEMHNYPWRGATLTDCVSEAVELVSILISKALTPGSFLDSLPGGQQVRFHGDITCTSPGGAEVYHHTWTLFAGTVVDFAGLEPGTTCVVTEDLDATVQGPDGDGNFTPIDLDGWVWARPQFHVNGVPTNEFDAVLGEEISLDITNTLVGGVELTKDVTGAVDGAALPQYTFNWAATFDREPIDGSVVAPDGLADPVPGTSSGTITLGSGETAVPQDAQGNPLLFPAGTEITFTEVPPEDVPGHTFDGVTITPNPATIGTDGEATTPVVATNAYIADNATFQIQKLVTGEGENFVPSDTEFTVEYSVNGIPALDPLVILASGEIVSGPTLKHGDVIDFTEATPPDGLAGIHWGTVSIEPESITLDSELPETVLVTVTNEALLDDATFTIHKGLAGSGAGLVPPDTPFQVTYTVNGIPAPAPLTILANGTIVNGPTLNHGDVIEFTEVTPPVVPGVSFGAAAITPDSIITLDGEAPPVVVTVINQAAERTGTFQIRKELTGDGAGLVPPGTLFEVNYTIDGVPAPEPLRLPTSGAIVSGPAGLPEGAVIEFTEVVPPTIPGISWNGATLPDPIVIDPDVETPVVTVTNNFTANDAIFRIQKALTGNAAALVPGTTAFTISYTVNGTPAEPPLTVLADGTIVDSPVLNHGDLIRVSEVLPNPDLPGVTWGGVSVTPEEFTLDASAASPVVVTVTNEAILDTATFTIRKLVTGGGAALVPPGTSFRVAYAVHGVPAATPLIILASGEILNGPILNHGDVIVFTEATPPDLSGIVWGTTTITPATLTLDSEVTPVEVVVTNVASRAPATFQIAKSVSGPADGEVPDSTEFLVNYAVNGVQSPDPLTILADGTAVDGPTLEHGDVVTFSEGALPNVPLVEWGPVTITPDSITLDSEDPEPVVVTVNNVANYAPATFQVRKLIVGDVTGVVPPTVPLQVNYTVNGVAAAQPLTVLTNGLAVDGPVLRHGDVLTFSEVTPPSIPGTEWGEVTIDPQTLTLDASATTPVLVTVTNQSTIDPASFQIQKVLTGDGVDFVPPGTAFAIDYTVNGEAADTPLAVRADGSITNAPTLRHGDRITFSEATPPDIPGVVWGAVTVLPASLTLDSLRAEPVLVTVTNEVLQASGSFQIRKALSGSGVSVVPPDTTFNVQYAVNDVPSETPLIIRADGTLVDGPELEHGDVVTFSEDTPAAVDGATWGASRIEPSSITIDVTAPAAVVTVTNEATAVDVVDDNDQSTDDDSTIGSDDGTSARDTSSSGGAALAFSGSNAQNLLLLAVLCCSLGFVATATRRRNRAAERA
jgi:choice-of-anchor A domain-containing protein